MFILDWCHDDDLGAELPSLILINIQFDTRAESLCVCVCDDPQRNRPTCSNEAIRKTPWNWVGRRPPYGTRRRDETWPPVRSSAHVLGQQVKPSKPQVTHVELAANLTSHRIPHWDTTYHISLNPNTLTHHTGQCQVYCYSLESICCAAQRIGPLYTLH